MGWAPTMNGSDRSDMPDGYLPVRKIERQLFIDNIGKMLRPSSAVRAVALSGRSVIRSVYPSLLQKDSTAPAPVKAISNAQPRVLPSTVDGAVLAFDVKGLVALAQRSNCVLELVPEVGQFIAAGDPLFRIYKGGDNVSDRSLRNSVAVGAERTPEQDPLFAFRVLADIASKALSPAINDPTTAVQAIDQTADHNSGYSRTHPYPESVTECDLTLAQRATTSPSMRCHG